MLICLVLLHCIALWASPGSSRLWNLRLQCLSRFNFHTFMFTLSHFRLHTFTLSLSHFHTFACTLSHFPFHTFTISLSHFHLSPGSSHSLWNLRVQCFSHHRLPLLPCSSRRRTHQESFIFFVVIFSFHQNQLRGSLLLPSCPQLRWESVAFLPEMVFLSFKGEKIYLGETNKGVFPLQERAIQPSALQVFFLLSHNPIQSNPIQSNPIQSNPIQSNPIQSNPMAIGVDLKSHWLVDCWAAVF